MLFLLVGRTGRGKDTLRECLENDFDWKFVKSCTTRPKRTANESTHVFVTREDAAAVSHDDIVAYTKIGEYEYYVTKDMLTEDIQGYIIDPDGIRYLCEKLPNQKFHVIYLEAPETEVSAHIAKRGNPAVELQRYAMRSVAEDTQFTQFEEMIASNSLPNTLSVTVMHNDYKEGTMHWIAGVVDKMYRKMK